MKKQVDLMMQASSKFMALVYEVIIKDYMQEYMFPLI